MKEKQEYINVDELIAIHPHHPKKSTVYNWLCKKRIPSEIIWKPKGSKRVLFHKDLVLQWIATGMPKPEAS